VWRCRITSEPEGRAACQRGPDCSRRPPADLRLQRPRTTGRRRANDSTVRESGVGCVSNLFVASGAQNFGGVIESLHLLTFVAPGAALAAAAGVPCVVGKSMAISRRAIGGFEAFRHVLAEDQAIGVATKNAGVEVVVSPVVVRNVVVRRTIRRALGRQIAGTRSDSLSPDRCSQPRFC
jgi:glycosyl transferase family 21